MSPPAPCIQVDHVPTNKQASNVVAELEIAFSDHFPCQISMPNPVAVTIKSRAQIACGI